MDLETFAAALTHRGAPLPEDAIRAFEARLGAALPPDYRVFLARCNGGYADGRLAFPRGEERFPIQHVGGLREEPHFSLDTFRAVYQGRELRIPRGLLWIADDPLGNAYCLGRGGVYFWDHEREPEPGRWDGRVETAGNLTWLAQSFEAFVAGVEPHEG